MQEKRILPRRRGGVLLCVLGCLFVFFVKTEKDLAAAGQYPVDGRICGKHSAVDRAFGMPTGCDRNVCGLSCGREAGT